MESLWLETGREGLVLRRQDGPDPGELAPEEIAVSVEAAIAGTPEIARARGVDHVEPGIAVVGRTLESGPDANRAQGVRVACGPSLPCGECARCRRGAPATCETRRPLGPSGGRALGPRAVARARWLCELTPPIDIGGPEAALLGREAALAYALYARAGPAPGARAVVLGRGAVARLCVEILAAKGVAPIAIAEDAAWAEIAEGAGAAALRVSPGAEPDALARALRDMEPEDGAGGAGSLVLETTGEAELRRRALELARPGGTAALAGRRATGAPRADEAALGDAIDDDVVAIGVAGPHPDLVPEVAALAARGDLDLGAAAQPCDPEELPRVAEAVERGDLPGKVAAVTLERG